MDPKKTGTIISDARKNMNMTQKELADKLYVSDKAVSKWERGLCFPDISVLIPLTEILGISLYDLLKGESMSKNEVEEAIKNTIEYTNNEIKKKSKKNIIISSVVIGIILLISLITIISIKSNSEIGAIVDKDTIHNIEFYSNYKTTLSNVSSEKLELLIMKLPLKWKERTFDINSDNIEIKYGVSYKEVKKAYSDENYVKKAMIDISSVLFTSLDDLNTIKITYKDYSYSISKKELLNVYKIDNFNTVLNEEKWNNTISKKYEDKKFVDDTFNLYKKEIVKSKDNNK